MENKPPWPSPDVRISKAFIFGFSKSPFKRRTPPTPPRPNEYKDVVSNPGALFEWIASDGRRGKISGLPPQPPKGKLRLLAREPLTSHNLAKVPSEVMKGKTPSETAKAGVLQWSSKKEGKKKKKEDAAGATGNTDAALDWAGLGGFIDDAGGEEIKATDGNSNEWTTEQDEELLKRKNEGETWATIAGGMGKDKAELNKRWKVIMPQGWQQPKTTKGGKKQNQGGKGKQKEGKSEAKKDEAAANENLNWGDGDWPSFSGEATTSGNNKASGNDNGDMNTWDVPGATDDAADKNQPSAGVDGAFEGWGDAFGATETAAANADHAGTGWEIVEDKPSDGNDAGQEWGGTSWGQENGGGSKSGSKSGSRISKSGSKYNSGNQGNGAGGFDGGWDKTNADSGNAGGDAAWNDWGGGADQPWGDKTSEKGRSSRHSNSDNKVRPRWDSGAPEPKKLRFDSSADVQRKSRFDSGADEEKKFSWDNGAGDFNNSGFNNGGFGDSTWPNDGNDGEKKDASKKDSKSTRSHRSERGRSRDRSHRSHLSHRSRSGGRSYRSHRDKSGDRRHRSHRNRSGDRSPRRHRSRSVDRGDRGHRSHRSRRSHHSPSTQSSDQHEKGWVTSKSYSSSSRSNGDIWSATNSKSSGTGTQDTSTASAIYTEIHPDDTFSLNDLRVIGKILKEDNSLVWLRVASRFRDKTGRIIDPKVFEEKLASKKGKGGPWPAV